MKGSQPRPLAVADPAQAFGTPPVAGVIEFAGVLDGQHMPAGRGSRSPAATMADDFLRGHVGMLQQAVESLLRGTVVGQMANADRAPFPSFDRKAACRFCKDACRRIPRCNTHRPASVLHPWLPPAFGRFTIHYRIALGKVAKMWA